MTALLSQRLRRETPTFLQHLGPLSMAQSPSAFGAWKGYVPCRRVTVKALETAREEAQAVNVAVEDTVQHSQMGSTFTPTLPREVPDEATHVRLEDELGARAHAPGESPRH